MINSPKITAKMGIKKLWNIVPLVIKFMSLSTIVLCIINLFFSKISYLLSNVPLNTIYNFQIWRLYTTALITTNIINVFLGLVFWTREGSSLETRLGTMKYIMIFIRNTFLIEVLYTLIMSIISLILKSKKFLSKKMKNTNKASNVKIKSNIPNSIQNSNITVSKIQISSPKITAKMGIKKLWNIVPLVIKFMSLSTIILCIINLFFSKISYLLSNVPLNTIYNFQIWRLCTTALITTNIINVFLGLVFWTREGSSLETRLGTMKYIMIFIRNTFLIEILYTLIMSIISLILKNKKFLSKKMNDKGVVSNCGFLPVIMCEITLLCICNPNTKVKFLSIPWEFKAKYYPFIWFLVFCVVNNYHNDIEIFTGIIYAFIYQHLLRRYLSIPDSLIEKMENNCCFSWMLKITGFVSVSHITNKFMDEKTNQRISGQILNINKANERKKAQTNVNSGERTVKISTTPSEYTNRSENSMISNATPPSLFENSFEQNKNNNS